MEPNSRMAKPTHIRAAKREEINMTCHALIRPTDTDNEKVAKAPCLLSYCLALIKLGLNTSF